MEEKLNYKFPIAEMFDAPQGEGLWAGTLMSFIRLAGCTVGRRMTPEEKTKFGIINDYQEKCTAWNNNSFACDTNYRATNFLYLDELYCKIMENRKSTGINHVVFTGGEPLMHTGLPELIKRLLTGGVAVHVETSGTIDIVQYQHLGVDVKGSYLWITVSPKANFLRSSIRYSNEIKILIGEDFDVVQFEDVFQELLLPRPGAPLVYIQPINFEYALNKSNIKRCLALQKQYPHFKISIQLHKILETR